MAKLTDKQQRFVEAKAQGIGNTQAALLAGFAPTSAAVTASQLSKRDDIKAAIRAAKKAAGVKDTAPANVGEDGKAKMKDHYDSPLDLFLDVMNMPAATFAIRFEAAKQAMPFVNPRIGEKGKKESAKDRAKEIATG